MSKECRDKDINIYRMTIRRLEEINSMISKYSYDITFNEHSGDYVLRGKDSIGRVVFIRTFTYCDRLMDYISGMLHMLENMRGE